MSSKRTSAKLLAELDVSVSVDIGEFQLTAADIVDLAPGQTFEFSYDQDVPATLRVCGEEIAIARFVKDDKGLFLEVISISDDS